ncbi:SH3 domain-containing protein, partial [Mordavella massiliensis]|nr:SH3 domain-containing protein [Mordavella massiliensis]
MGSNLRKGLFLVTITGAVAAFPYTVQASDAAGQEHVLPQAGIGEVLSDCYLSDKEIQVEDYLVPEEKGEYLDMAFADVQTFLYIRSEPTTESEWLGKLYPGNAARILGPVGEWTKIQSGQVTGYV